MPKCYIDSSTMLRLLDVDHESQPEIEKHLDENNLWDSLCTSKLTQLECTRVAIRDGLPELSDKIDSIFESIHVIGITDDVLARAMEIPHHIKSLDAIHVGSIIEASVSSVISHDKSMVNVLGLLKGDPDWPTANYQEVVTP